jgi:hypothetical protein
MHRRSTPRRKFGWAEKSRPPFANVFNFVRSEPAPAQQITATLEIVSMDDGWWYDIRTDNSSITPHEPFETYDEAIAHATQAAARLGVRITKVGDE